MSKFEADSYSRYRIEYPRELFSPLASFVCQRNEPFSLIDLGAGTGLSALSFLRFFENVQEALLVDPDPDMLARALSWTHLVKTEVMTQVGSGQMLQAENPVDLVLVGSAWHWMNTHATIRSIEKVLKPGGAVFLFEYQFPKAREEQGGSLLNDWVRREFNSKWKEPGQVPRGTFHELISGFRESASFFHRGENELERDYPLFLEDFLGLIFSQSRYLAFERGMVPERVGAERARVREELENVWGKRATRVFRYCFQGVRFQTRDV